MKVFKESKYICNGFWLAITTYDSTIHYEQCADIMMAYNIYDNVASLEKFFGMLTCITNFQ